MLPMNHSGEFSSSVAWERIQSHFCSWLTKWLRIHFFFFFFFLQMKIETVKCHLLCLKVKSLFTFVVPRTTGKMALGWKVNYSWGSSRQRSGCFGQIDAAGWALCQNFCIWQTPFVTEPPFVSSIVDFSFALFFRNFLCPVPCRETKSVSRVSWE